MAQYLIQPRYHNVRIRNDGSKIRSNDSCMLSMGLYEIKRGQFVKKIIIEYMQITWIVEKMQDVMVRSL